ncbi:LysR family transcriptional regulator [Streptomyces sp. RerS4]|uniref:LysR family transcriptional regulator n=1 Tax=Streptomyces sp. RerS4 TaxID=2942449 RepID=UPI00201BC598|nr:LysR family transcriptional regulator [Streptomyces sp. RerS4]UQW99296.1 LysR family transcriptional regulator [Streptomyces sp. RerS4]
MERYEIEVFLALAEELHFRRTAERLGLAQGRTSQVVKKLERRIGAPLFVRTSRSVALTALGVQFRDDLLPGHRQIQHAVARAVEAARMGTSVLRVGYSGAFVAKVLLRAADTFATRFPGSRVEIKEIQIGDPFGPIRAGHVDLQVTERPLDEPDLTPGPVLLSRPRVLMVPTGHAFARRSSLSLEDLADTELVTITGPVPLYWLDYHFPRFTPQGRLIPQGPAATYWPEVLPLISAGAGVSPAADIAEQYYAHPGVTWVPFHDADPIEYSFVWRTSHVTDQMRAFAETCLEHV